MLRMTENVYFYSDELNKKHIIIMRTEKIYLIINKNRVYFKLYINIYCTCNKRKKEY